MPSAPDARAPRVLGPLLFLEALYVSIVVPLLPTFEQNLDASAAELGLLVGAYSAGLVVAGALMIVLAPRFSIRRILLAGCALLAAASGPFGFVDSLAPLIALRVIQGFGGALIFAGAIAWTIKVSPTGQGETIGRLWRWTVSGAIAGPLAGAIGSATGLGVWFIALSAAQLALARSVLRYRGPRPSSDPETSLSWRGLRRLGPGLVLMIVPAALIGALEVVLPIRLGGGIGANAAVIGLLFVIAAVAEAAVAPFAGRSADRLGPRRPIAAGFAIAAAGTLAVYWTSNRPLLAVLLFATGIGIGLTLIPITTWTTTESERAGIDLLITWSLINVITSAAVFAGSAGAGGLAEVSGVTRPLLICAGLCAVAALAVARVSVLTPAEREIRWRDEG
jgi:DHA1 family multidrug resistance protein-like MFS transporter